MGTDFDGFAPSKGNEEGTVVEPEETEAPVEETEAPEADDEPTDAKPADARDAQITQLMEQNQRLMDMIQNAQKPPVEDPKAKAETMPTFVDADLQKRIFEDQDPAALNEAISKGITYAIQHIGGKLPEVIEGSVKRHTSETLQVQDFYTSNPDLVPYKQYVAMTAQELSASNPSWTPAKLFTETAKEFRKRFNLTKTTAPAKKPVAVAGGKAGGQPPKSNAAPAATKQKAAVDAMFDDLNGE